MPKIISNLTKKISLELVVLLVFIFLVAAGFVSASWNAAETNLANVNDQIDNVKWNALVSSINGICGTNCSSGNVTAAKSTSSNSSFYLTEQNWFGLADLIKDALKNCACRVGTCDQQWSKVLNSSGISRGSWNALVDEVYRKCVGSDCSKYDSLAMINGDKLVKSNWNYFVDLASTTMINCISGGSSCTPDCTGKNCGPDNCGGTCGTCSGVMTCDNDAGQCVNTSSSQLFYTSGTCSALCTSLNGTCNSVGMDASGTNGFISSVSEDKSGQVSCAIVAGTCSSSLSNRNHACNGFYADWAYCNCTICSSNWKQGCTNGLGDASCVNAGTYNCNGNCIGATLKAAGTSCGTNAQCSATGRCVTCGSNYGQSCTNNLGDASCVNAGTYNCSGDCIGATLKASSTICGTGMSCNSTGNCQTCTPSCSGKSCGPDGCGGTCGTCDASSNYVCVNSTGQCVVATGHLLSGSGTCNSLCAGLNGICQSVGTDLNGANGYINSATTVKLGGTTCSVVAGTCASPLGNQGVTCDGYNADWTYCNCTACNSNYKQSCTNNLGDASCVNAGTYDCNGNCTGATLKAAGTSCGTTAQCDASGKCLACGSSYGQSCTNNLGDASCVNAGTYDCFGTCIGATRKASSTNCGTGMTCNSTGNCQTCTPSCSGKSCGPDGCGGTCGTCDASSNYACVNSTGQCVVATGHLLSGSGNCNSLCASLNGVCQSIGNDLNGTNGYIDSVTTDSKSGAKSCSAVAGTCASPLGNQGVTCDGYNADWTYCNCTICGSNYKQSCTNGLGDASCVNAGTYDCNGNCTGATLKAAGTSCGTNAQCNASGRCIACDVTYQQSCTNGLGDASCVNAGAYDCSGNCIGATRKASSTNCGTGMTCNSTGNCQTCTPSCSGKNCGPDSCGGTCGTCDASSNYVCVYSTGQCMLAAGHFLSGSGTCNSLCAGLNGICQSVGNDTDGTNGYINSVTTDSKGGGKSCASVAGTCASPLGNQGITCNGYNADWTFCSCKICASDWNQSCTNGLGDASCVNAGTYDCNGNCIGATLKSAGTSCGTNAKCDASGKCITCGSSYGQSCTNGLGDPSCVNAGTYDCFGTCSGATHKAFGVFCGTGLICDGNGSCIPCVPACSGKVCGSDGCGSTCGTCGSNLLCDSYGQCVSSVAYLLSAPVTIDTCSAFCAGKGGTTCKSIGTDINGTNGFLSSAGAGSVCSNVAANCSSPLSNQNVACNGIVADWTYCRCGY